MLLLSYEALPNDHGLIDRSYVSFLPNGYLLCIETQGYVKVTYTFVLI